MFELLGTGFRYDRGMLCAGAVPVPELIERHGSPLWIYNQGVISNNLRQLNGAFPWAKKFMAIKANFQPEIMKLAREHDFGFDVVSGPELQMAVEVGANGEDIVFAGAAKPTEELRLAVEVDVTIAIESFGEAERLAAVCHELDKPCRVLLRYNTATDPAVGDKTNTAKADGKFGLSYNDVRRILFWNPDCFDIVGIHTHIGSPITRVGDYIDAAIAALPLIEESGASVYNIGGGWPIQYDPDKPVPPLTEYASAIKAWHDEYAPQVEIWMEPGRYIVANSCILVTTVQYSKSRGYVEVATCDAGMADLVRPAMYGSFHQIVPVVEPKPWIPLLPTKIGGPNCESSDFLSQSPDIRRLAQMHCDDLLAVFEAGAYGETMSSNYNGNRRAAAIMVLGEEVKLLSPRETMEDIMRRFT